MASFRFKNAYLKNSYIVVGPYEKKGFITNYDYVMSDLYNKCKSFEKAEVDMQLTAIDGLMKKNLLNDQVTDLIIGGDLSNQIATTSYSVSKYQVPFIGIYSACATFCEGLLLSSLFIDNELNNIINITSCHNLNTEKQFRYPVEYGAPKKECSSFTVTAAVASLVTSSKTNIKIESGTIGKVSDYGVKDANNMGAIMAPAAYQVLLDHLKDLDRDISYYDLVLTGDLGSVGSVLFKRLLDKENIKLPRYIDSGCEVFKDKQNVKAGASGCACLPMVLFSRIIPEHKYKRILMIATGSLHSPSLVNQKNSLPGIAHAISLEVLD